MSIAVYPLAMVLPETFTFDLGSSYPIVCSPMKAYICVMCGLWSGLIIGFITEIFTSNNYSPV
jgi:H+-translocating diphosphatase